MTFATSWLPIAAATLVPLLTGLGLVRVCLCRATRPLALGRAEHAALGWLSGYGWIGAVTSIALLAGAPLDLAILWPLAALPILGLSLRSRVERPPAPVGVARIVLVVTALAGIVIAVRLFVEAISVPIAAHDEFAIWGLKAMWFRLDGGLDPALLTLDRNASLHPDYPLGQPAFGAWLLAHAGTVDERLLKLPSPALWVAMVVLLAGEARRRVGALAAGPIALGVGSVDALHVQGTLAMADLPVGVFALAAWGLLERARGRDGLGVFALVALLLAFAVNTKNEAMVLVPAAGLVVYAAGTAGAGRRAITSLVVLLGPALLALPWLLFKRSHGLYSDLLHGAFVFGDPAHGGPPPGIGRLPSLVRTTAEAAVQPGWDGFWWLVAIGLLAALAMRFAGRTPIGPAARFALPPLALTAGFWIALALSPHDPGWHAATALPRLLVQTAPCTAVALLAIAAGRRTDYNACGA